MKAARSPISLARPRRPALPAVDSAQKDPLPTPKTPMVANNHKHLVDILVQSKLYQEYERAFSEATGLPLTLRPIESWQIPHHGKRKENPFCAMITSKSRSCAACLQTHQELTEAVCQEPVSVTCAMGLCDTAIPVRVGDEAIGFLQTGQLFRKKPTEAQFNRAAIQIAEWGLDFDMSALREAYFGTPVLTTKTHESVTRLLAIFAEHLSIVSNQIVMQQQKAEPPLIAKAKEYIRENQAEDLSLGQVAKAVNTSTFYFCKMFKKVTGINFTDYLSRVRIEKAKNLLLNPNLRVSEIAFEVGFQSLTHFNRVFKRIVGHSPTEYRGQLPST